MRFSRGETADQNCGSIEAKSRQNGPIVSSGTVHFIASCTIAKEAKCFLVGQSIFSHSVIYSSKLLKENYHSGTCY